MVKPLKHDMNDAEANQQRSSAIEQVWEIVEGSPEEEFPFCVICTIMGSKKLAFPCLTLAEAEAKINAVAHVMYGKQPLATC